MLRKRVSAGAIVITATMTIAWGALAAVPATATTSSMTNYHFDLGHTGVDPSEPSLAGLSPGWSSVSLDGRVYGEPLVLNNSVYVATQQNTVYALDAGTGTLQWSLALAGSPYLLPPVPKSHVDSAATIGSGCGNIDPLGIIGTPVIDPGLGSAGTLFAVAETWDGSTDSSIKHELVAVDLSAHTATHHNIDPAGVGFDTGATRALEQQRAALALAGGKVIVPYGGLSGDCGGYHGFGVSIAENLTGTPGTFEVNPPGTGSSAGDRAGGIWGTGGPAVDGSGNVYMATGNGFEASTSPYKNTDGIIKLDSGMNLLDYFGPTVWRTDDGADKDLGSQGPLLIPRQSGNPLVFAVGKQTIGYLLNSGALSSNSNHIGGEMFSATVCDQESFGASAYMATSATAGFLYVPCREGMRGLTVDTSNASAPTFARSWTGPSDASGPPIVAGGLVWAHGSSQLYGLNPATGAVVADLTGVNTAYNFSTPSTTAGILYYVGNNVVRAFRTPAPGAGFLAGGTGPDNAVHVFGNTSGFASKGGQLLAAPAIAGVPRNGLAADPLYLGTGLDHNVWVRSDSQGWQQLASGGAYCIDNPAATVVGAPGSATLYVACQGGDHSLWYTSGPVVAGSLPTLGGWAPLGGGLSAGPAVASVGGTVTFLVIGPDHQAWSRTLSAGYQPFAAHCNGHPALATSANGTSFFACDGTDGALWHATNPGGGWGGAASPGGHLIDGPGIAALNTPTFFVEGTDNSIWEWSAGGGWRLDGGQVRFGAAASVL